MPTQAQMQAVQPTPWGNPAPVPAMRLEFLFGLNENISPAMQECSAGYNYELQYNYPSLKPRPPFDLVGTATNGGAITGIMQLVKRDNSQTTLVAAGSTMYKWDGTSSGFTSVGSITTGGLQRDTYWSLTDVLIITDVNLKNVVGQWDGTTFSALSTGLASSLYAKYGVVFGNRVWLFNITYGATAYPDMILVCAFENIGSWDTSTRGGPTTVGGGSFSTGLEAFYLLMPDLKPINGVALYKNALIVSTSEGHLWQINGTNAKDYTVTPFYEAEPAVANEAIANIGDDVLYVRNGGAIALLSATLDYGNVFASNLSTWIPNTTKNLSTINKIVYDVQNQKVHIFTASKVLVLFKNLLAAEAKQVENGLSPWGVYITSDISGFNTSAARYMYTPGTSSWNVYWGDSTGRVLAMNGTGNGDAGSSSIDCVRTSRHIGVEIIRPWPWTRRNITGRVQYRRQAAVSATLALTWDDEYATTSTSVSLKGPTVSQVGAFFGASNYYSGTIYYSEGFAFQTQVSNINVQPGGKGPGFYATVSVNSNQGWQIDAVEFD